MSYSLVTSKKIPIDIFLDNIFQHKTDGFFIELGANDGITQSNTAYFEFQRNWTGILIEPSVKGYELCKKNRPNSICINCACVSNEYKHDIVHGNFSGNSLMGSVDGLRQKGFDNSLISVKALSLEKILDMNIEITQKIDFLSLDVEGYELNVLKGLNFNKYKPKYMLIEVYNIDYVELCKYLNTQNYYLVDNVTKYNKIDNPGWDGIHNDFLFKYKN